MDETVQLPSKDEQQPATVVMLRDSLASLIEQLQEAEEILSPETLELIDRAVVTLTIIEDSRSGRKRRSLEITREHLEDLRKAERAPHPEEALLEELDTRRPRFLPFEDDHRLLRGEYTHEELENPPDALANLLRLAEIDIRQLRRALNNNDPASRETITTRANSVLRDKFTEAWGQSFLSVHIQADTDVLRILINSEDEFSQIAERSDGLKAFVALFSYTAVQSPGQEKPVLLIDEAERHLHYDAQADLVRVFENQDRAAKIIYTTHSAGCLPSDLGRGVRAVVQILDNLIDTGKSSINNSFWTEGAGFSPLMLAMGASLLALVPTRRAVFAEGPSDMMLLPSMFRETANEGQLGFQVAPGISVVSADDIAALELEAPRIAYLVDGDDGGDKIIAKLKGGGVPDEMIVQLERPYATEDLLNLKVLVTAINTELRRSHGDVHQIDESILGKHGRMLKLTEWCIGKGVDPPSKSRVAAHVVEDMRNRTILDLERVPKVSRALAEIRKILFPEG
ncbi:MAG: ATP-dependent endonuclease [Anaerolineales bacterium]